MARGAPTCWIDLADPPTTEGARPEYAITERGGCWQFDVTGVMDGVSVVIERSVDHAGSWFPYFTIETAGIWYVNFPRNPANARVRVNFVGVGVSTSLTVKTQSHPDCECCLSNPSTVSGIPSALEGVATAAVPAGVQTVVVAPPSGFTWDDLKSLRVKRLDPATEQLGWTGEIHEGTNTVYLSGIDATAGQHSVEARFLKFT